MLVHRTVAMLAVGIALCMGIGRQARADAGDDVRHAAAAHSTRAAALVQSHQYVAAVAEPLIQGAQLAGDGLVLDGAFGLTAQVGGRRARGGGRGGRRWW